MKKNIVSRLIRGSQNLNRMENEIKQVVMMVIGMLPATHLVGAHYVSDTYRWDVTQRDGKWVIFGSVKSKEEAFRVYSSLVGLAGGTHYIKQTYEALPILVNGLFENVMGLRYGMRFILDAADVFSE